MQKIIDRLNEIEAQMEQNRLDAEESCEAEGYPTNGSNYELRVESWNKPLQEEMDVLVEEYDNQIVFVNGKWMAK